MIGKTEEAYFKKINAKGGINGRKINFISYDDAYSPPKAVEQARKLVESDEVLFVFNPLGTPSNTAIQKYLNGKKVPQLFVATGATKWNDAKDFPWTMGWQPSYQSEAQIYAKYLLKEKPDAKIAILYQNDDFGKDYLKGTQGRTRRQGSSMIIMEESYEISEPTIDSHIVKIKAAGRGRAAQIYAPRNSARRPSRRPPRLGWKPLQIMTNVSASVGAVMQPAGFENAQGVLSAAYAKDAADAQWKSDPGMTKWSEFIDKYMPGADRTDSALVYGYGAAQTLAKVLEMCGDDLLAGQRDEAGGKPEGLHARHAVARRKDQHQRHRFRSRSASCRCSASRARNGNCSARSSAVTLRRSKSAAEMNRRST